MLVVRRLLVGGGRLVPLHVRLQLFALGEGGLGGPAPTPKERIERAERLLGAGAGDSARSEAETLLDAKLPADLTARALKIVADAARRAGRVDVATATVNGASGASGVVAAAGGAAGRAAPP